MLSGSITTFQILALIACVIAVTIFIVLSIHGMTFGLSYVAVCIYSPTGKDSALTNFEKLTIAYISITPLFFALSGRQDIIDRFPPVLRGLVNLIVAGLVLTSGAVLVGSLKNKAYDGMDKSLIYAGADISILLS
jgi:hypothetical protein